MKGFPLSELQKDHVMLSLNDLIDRYKPKVDSERYEMQFIPVLGIQNEYADQHFIDYELKQKPHSLRTYESCWCDEFAKSKHYPRYIIKITIHPYNERLMKTSDGKYTMDLRPIYENEEKKCYFKHQASVRSYNTNDIYEMTKHEVKFYYQNIIDSLKEELDNINQELTQK